MIEINVKIDGKTDDEIIEMAERARHLDRVAGKVKDTIVSANRGINFDPGHPNSILNVRNGEGEVGATAPRHSYAELLVMPTRQIADVYHDYIVDGD